MRSADQTLEDVLGGNRRFVADPGNHSLETGSVDFFELGD